MTNENKRNFSPIEGSPAGRSALRSSERLRIIPPEELKCVWMVAGVLSYRLCNRAYECESCLLDKALQGGAER